MSSIYHQQSVKRIIIQISAILSATYSSQCYRPLTSILEEKYRIRFTEEMLFDIDSGLHIKEIAELVSCLVQRNYTWPPLPIFEVDQVVYLPTEFGYTKERVSKIIPLFSSDPEEFKKYAYYVSGNAFPLIPNVDFFKSRKEAFKQSINNLIRGN